MIPKVIHCVWLGNEIIPMEVQKNINDWKQKLPNYSMNIWTEKNIPLTKLRNENKFLNECYKRKLWAFVSDYIRLWILYNYGGIYLDTDVEIIKNFDPLLTNRGFMGYEAGNEKLGEYIGSGVIGAEKGNKTIKRLLSFYDGMIWNEEEFINTIIFKKLYLQDPTIFSEIKIYPRYFFAPYSPYDNYDDVKKINDKTYAIHRYSANWGLSLKGYLFITTKTIKNPLKRNLIKIKRIIGYMKRKKQNTLI